MTNPRLLVSLLVLPLWVLAHGDALEVTAQRDTLKFHLAQGTGTIEAVAPNVLRVSFLPTGSQPAPTLVLDPKRKAFRRATGRLSGLKITTPELSAEVQESQLMIGSGGEPLLRLNLEALAAGSVKLIRSDSDHLYGMRGIGLDASLSGASIFRDGGAHIAASEQGDGGASMAFTKKWGVFVDSVDGDFSTAANELDFTNSSRKDLDVYVVVGPPKATLSAVAQLTGPAPLVPRWSLGFMNSQWGLDEKELEQIVDGYRSRQIPLDAFILDFDYKAWGEDNYGEFRWNSTSNPGNVGPNKFPNGASGKLGADLGQKGVHLVGIMKPRVIVTNPKGGPTDAAKVGNANHWFVPGQKPYPEYFSNRLANDIDFSSKGARDWFWSHSRGLFETGISGWWNDEADSRLNSLEFFNMQRALYEGQRSVSNQRVWSINRNFYLGAQREAFGTWSGDIESGFDNMRLQATRMVATLNLGQPHWSMDTGGFGGHPSDENYARWIEFASMVPIMRVHGTYGEKRQPWRYGSVAETAAKAAIELRYRLIPTLYDLEHQEVETGIGIVRPMFWEFPEDSRCEDVTDQWMLGSSLLAAPVFEQGATSRTVYLPAGAWYRWDSGDPVDGGREITFPVDAQTWKDLPLFIKAGSIIVTKPVQQFDSPASEMELNVWPDGNGNASGEAYDDDGTTYSYEKGKFRVQRFELHGGKLTLYPAKGYSESSVKNFRVVLHGGNGTTAIVGGKNISIDPATHSFEMPAWATASIEMH